MDTLRISDWHKYNMASQRMHVLTYRQQREYEYEYILGSFQSNVSIDELNPDTNATVITNTSDNLIAVTWDSFTRFVDTTLKGEETLYITQYSSRICINKEDNTTEINDCFMKWYELNNRSDSAMPEHFIYTELDESIYVDVNSIHASDILDGPRDVFMFILMMFCFIWFFLVIDFFEDPSSALTLNELSAQPFRSGNKSELSFCISP
eukprot:13720_1